MRRGVKEWSCWLLHQPVNRGQYDENKLHNEAWRQPWKRVQEATLSPPMDFQTSQQSGRFGILVHMTLEIKKTCRQMELFVFRILVYFRCDVSVLHFLCDYLSLKRCCDVFFRRPPNEVTIYVLAFVKCSQINDAMCSHFLPIILKYDFKKLGQKSVALLPTHTHTHSLTHTCSWKMKQWG